MPRLGSMAGLPGYAYDERTERYRNLDTGRLVARSDVEDLLRGVTEVAQERMARLGAAVNDGLLSDEEFILAMQTEMRRTGNASASLAAGGWDRMTQADWGAQGQWMRGQNQYLMTFYEELQDSDKEWGEGEIERRAQSYTGAAFSRYWDQKNRSHGEEAMARWIIVDESACERCQALADMGEVPVSELPLPGEVHPSCRCSLEYVD